MSVKERRAKRNLDCYTIEEFYDFFKQFYEITTEYDNHIILKKTFNLHKSDVTIILHSFNDENRKVHEIRLYTWAGGWSHRQNGIHLEYTYRYNKEEEKYSDIYDWYIVDRSVGSYIKIEKSDILPTMVNFIIENEDSEHYELPLQLKRQLILDQLI